jgi:multidrug efflux pump subunit AcrA (membrane-fusion protein)
MISRLYTAYGKRNVRIVALLLIIIGIGLILRGDTGVTPDTQSESAGLPQVEVSTVGALVGKSDFTVVGTVTAVSEARLQAEAAGRITSVSVALGDTVSAGTVVASIENNTERALLLQAEGAYESAQAASLQSSSSLDEARITVQNTYRDAFSTVDTVVRSVIDQFYSNPGDALSGFKIGGTGRAPEFIEVRNDIEEELATWSATIAENFDNKSEEDLLRHSESVAREAGDLMATFVLLLSDNDIDESLSSEERAAYQATLAGGRASVDGVLSSISRARGVYDQAVIAGGESASGVSGSSAQIKSALGNLRSAQAAYEKTLIRTPISGVVNALYIKAGEYVTNGQAAALIANNGSLEVTTALGEDDLDSVVIGDTVRIDDAVVGTVTRLAPAVDPLSGKAEVRIGIAGESVLVNGSTVRVTFTRGQEREVESDTGEESVPLSALKLLPSGPVVFSVDEGVLTPHPVVLGRILGDTVLITEGLSADTVIVVDARGLKAGDRVEVVQ